MSDRAPPLALLRGVHAPDEVPRWWTVAPARQRLEESAFLFGAHVAPEWGSDWPRYDLHAAASAAPGYNASAVLTVQGYTDAGVVRLEVRHVTNEGTFRSVRKVHAVDMLIRPGVMAAALTLLGWTVTPPS